MQTPAASSSGRNTWVSSLLILLDSLSFGLILLQFAFVLWNVWHNRGISDDTWQHGLALLVLVFWGSVFCLLQTLNSMSNATKFTAGFQMSMLTVAVLFNPQLWRLRAYIERCCFLGEQDCELMLLCNSGTAFVEVNLDFVMRD